MFSGMVFRKLKTIVVVPIKQFSWNSSAPDQGVMTNGSQASSCPLPPKHPNSRKSKHCIFLQYVYFIKNMFNQKYNI